jgi:serine phosphatase RsbU (regulator of sigma subunit)
MMFLALADCTGHGVSGGFMTMIGHSLLNQLVINENILEPVTILSELDKRLLRLLRQKEASQAKIADGMDVVLLRFDATQTITFAAAHRPLWHFSAGQLFEYKGSRYPIGDIFFEEKIFEQQQIQWKKNDVIYLFSDGYADQLGENKSKFLTKRFRKLLQEISPLPMLLQQEILLTTIKEWQGNKEQTDDWLILGLKL